jgi:hypothetical protein
MFDGGESRHLTE